MAVVVTVVDEVDDVVVVVGEGETTSSSSPERTSEKWVMMTIKPKRRESFRKTVKLAMKTFNF